MRKVEITAYGAPEAVHSLYAELTAKLRNGVLKAPIDATL